jgi:hypothetical protein
VFASGVNELIFESDHDVVLEGWRWFDRSPHDSSIH